MEYRDINNESIKQGFYLETFYKPLTLSKDGCVLCDGKDEPRNRIVYIGKSPLEQELFSIINKANIVKLNPNYSRWLKPFEEEKDNLFPSSMDNQEIEVVPGLPPDLKHLEDQL